MTTCTSMIVRVLLLGTKACPFSLAHFFIENFPMMVEACFIKLFLNLQAFH